MRVRTFGSVCLAAAAVIASPILVPEASAAPAARVIWVSPTGSDTSTGAERSAPIRTLAKAHRLLCPANGCPGLGQPVEIRLEPGTHYLPDTGWQYFDETYPTRFVPADWRPGWTWPDVQAHGGRPKLDGRWTSTIGFQFTPRRPSRTGRDNLEFRYLEWTRYDDYALQIRGAGGRWAVGNTIQGNLFRYVGNWWNPRRSIGFGGLSLWSTDHNTVTDNHFVSIVNAPVKGDSNGHEHGIYMIQASHNTIRGNRFLDIGGDAVRAADRSSDNLVEANTFERVSSRGHVSDWYCRTNCSKPQYPSYGNLARRNTFRSFYPGPWVINPRLVYCYDRPGGACPSNRIRLEP